jgi:hypothetical protein
VLKEEKWDEVLPKLETSPRKSLAGLPQQAGVFASLAQNATKLLLLYPCKTTMVHKLYDAYREARLKFVTWYFYGVCAGERTSHSFCLAI